MAKKEIILGVTGSIACYKACDIVRALQKRGYGITVIMTEAAEKFITPLSLASLSRSKVYSGMFGKPDAWDIEHVSLAEKADLILVAPATACIINKLACGLCDDLLCCTVLATKAPVLIAPAMNSNMYENKITQESLAKLKGIGYRFVGPRSGRLASGKVGIGHLASAEDILRAVSSILK